VLELAGAAGLLVPRTARWAAGGLSALLVVMFPANVHAALEGTGTPLLPRTLMQLLFLAATLAVVVGTGAGRGARRSAAEGARPDRDARPARAH
jgi:uncharacterized membrane protein